MKTRLHMKKPLNKIRILTIKKNLKNNNKKLSIIMLNNTI